MTALLSGPPPVESLVPHRDPALLVRVVVSMTSYSRIFERFTQSLSSCNLCHMVQAQSLSKGAQTRAAILDAAIVRFGRDGYRATSVADIARDAGVGGTVAYAYFPNKEALFLAALDEDAANVIHEGVTTVLDQPVSSQVTRFDAGSTADEESDRDILGIPYLSLSRGTTRSVAGTVKAGLALVSAGWTCHFTNPGLACHTAAYRRSLAVP